MDKNKTQLIAALFTIFAGTLAIVGGFLILTSEDDEDTTPATEQIEDDAEATPPTNSQATPDVNQAAVDSAISTILEEFNSYEPFPPEEEFVYIIEESQIQNEDIEPTDQIIWDIFTKIAVDEKLQNTVSEMRIFGQTSQDLEDTLAFVEPLSTTEDDWSLGVNYDEVKDPRTTVLTLIHEYMHIETLQDSEVVSSDESDADCQTLLIAEGCLTANSILYKWHQAHWDSNDLTFSEEDSEDTAYERYIANQSLFINDYAATNTLEDFAESFSFWVLNDSSVPVDKQQYMDNDSTLVELKNKIRSSLVN